MRPRRAVTRGASPDRGDEVLCPVPTLARQRTPTQTNLTPRSTPASVGRMLAARSSAGRPDHSQGENIADNGHSDRLDRIERIQERNTELITQLIERQDRTQQQLDSVRQEVRFLLAAVQGHMAQPHPLAHAGENPAPSGAPESERAGRHDMANYAQGILHCAVASRRTRRHCVGAARQWPMTVRGP